MLNRLTGMQRRKERAREAGRDAGGAAGEDAGGQAGQSTPRAPYMTNPQSRLDGRLPLFSIPDNLTPLIREVNKQNLFGKLKD